MSLKQAYEFRRMVVQGEIETWEAQERQTGRTVLVHLLIAGRTPGNQAILKEAERFRTPANDLITTGDDGGLLFVVTGLRFGTVGLREWMRANSVPSQNQAQTEKVMKNAPNGSASNNPAPGEFTRMFGAAGSGIPPFEAARPTPASVVQRPNEPGEFTRMFPPQPPNRTASEPPQRDEIDLPKSKLPIGLGTALPPGEFTRIFQSPFSSGLGDNLPAPSPVNASGEFTKFYEGTTKQSSNTPSVNSTNDFLRAPLIPAAPPKPAAIPETASTPGDFTKFFGSATPAIPSLPPTPAALVPPPALPISAPSQSPAVPPLPAEPSPYTVMINAPKPARLEPSPAKPELPNVQSTSPGRADAAPDKAGSPMAQSSVIIVFLSLLLLAILVVLFFAVHR
jgi:hypothetical protein